MARSSLRLEHKRGPADHMPVIPALLVLALVTSAVLALHVALGGALPFGPLTSLGWRLLWAAADR